MSEHFLEVAELSSGYGEGLVLQDVSFRVPNGSSLAILGRNGVGKSTLVLTLAGHLRARSGTIVLSGTELTQCTPRDRVAAGVAWVPEARETFPSLSVDEHLRIARRAGHWTCARVYELFPRLLERRGNFGNQLSGGEQQMLAIGRALMTNPRILMLDEPLEGLAPIVVAEIAACIRQLVAEGTSVVIVEQHAAFALDVAVEAVVLERGRVVHRGSSRALREDRELLDTLVGMRRLHAAGVAAS